VAATDLRDGTQATIAAPLVVNAAGPWVDVVLANAGIIVTGKAPRPSLIGGSRGSHIVVDALAGVPETACYAEAGADGRPFFVIPWNGLTLIGTTDIAYGGDPGAARPDSDEIAYLVAETNRLFPASALTRESIHYMYAGVRPLPRTTGREQSAITRRHHIHHHRDVARGLYSVLGGKLTTYRHLAEQVVDRVAARIGRDLSGCTTARRPLPGAAANAAEVHEALFSGTALGPAAIGRLVGLYGCRAADVAEIARRHPELAAEICPLTHAIAAEVVFAFEAEMALTLADCLMRRTMLGLGKDLGLAVLPDALEVARRHFGWNAARVEEERRQVLMETDALRPPSVAAAKERRATRSSTG
jgi:glycerol-3-phosphate dehydrogenase